MKEIQVAIEKTDSDSIRLFYIAEDDPSAAIALLRKARPDVGMNIQFYPLNEAAGKTLGMTPGEVLEWRIGERIIAKSLSEPDRWQMTP